MLLVTLGLSTDFPPLSARAESASISGHWVSAWSAAMHAPLAFPGLLPTPVFENQTIRMIVRPSLSGGRVRIRLSNAFGSAPLVIGAAHVALAAQADKIVRESDHTLTFSGKSPVGIPLEAPIVIGKTECCGATHHVRCGPLPDRILFLLSSFRSRYSTHREKRSLRIEVAQPGPEFRTRYSVMFG